MFEISLSEISFLSSFSLLTFQCDLEIKEEISVSHFYDSLSYSFGKEEKNSKDIVSSPGLSLFLYLFSHQFCLCSCLILKQIQVAGLSVKAS